MHETLGTKMQGAVRISVSHKNTEEEIDRTANLSAAIACVVLSNVKIQVFFFILISD